jgi:hypothetical protein
MRWSTVTLAAVLLGFLAALTAMPTRTAITDATTEVACKDDYWKGPPGLPPCTLVARIKVHRNSKMFDCATSNHPRGCPGYPR